MRAERLTDVLTFHGEGPVWWEAWGGLRFVDLFAGDVLALGDDGSASRVHVGDVAAALRPRHDGGAVIAARRSFVLEDADGTLTALPDLWSGEHLRFNDGGCDPDGRFYCGSMAADARPGAGSLLRLDAERTVDVVLTGVTVSNGLEWTPDGTAAYYVDTPTRMVSRLAYDAAAGLHDRHDWAPVPGGLPDGLTVDAEGGVWVALYDGHAVLGYDAAGPLQARVEVPPEAGRVTACTFGGAALDRLFITTSAEDLPAGAAPAAGSLYVARPGVTGLPARAFAG